MLKYGFLKYSSVTHYSIFQPILNLLQKAILDQKIDLKEIEREVMGTEEELKLPSK